MSSSRDHRKFVREHTAVERSVLCPELSLRLATELTPLWEATEAWLELAQLPPPFWAFTWPGSEALARFVLDAPEVVRGARVLDFGSGTGLAAVASMKSGAREATAADIDPFAAAAALENAALNAVDIRTTSEDLIGCGPEAWDVVLAGDVCYERPLAHSIVPWLRTLAARDVAIYLADPGRAYPPSERLEERASYEVPTILELEDRTSRTTTVWRLLP